jgi:hypothetical protein
LAYWKDKWTFLNSNEYEFKFAGNYGAKGEKRAERKKATPEQIKKQNQKNKENRVRRLIKANFTTRDYWMTLKYPQGVRKEVKEVQEDLKKLIVRMRNRYKRKEEQFKFIYRMEIGKMGGIHIHILINRIGGDTDLIVRDVWEQGTVNYQTLYDYGGYKKLADYIVKKPDEETCEQLELFEEEDQKQFIKISSSRNLIRPEPERKVYGRRTVERIIRDGPQPTEGYYIDNDSVHIGINPYTGMSYIKYTEYRVKEISRRQPEGRGKPPRKR